MAAADPIWTRTKQPWITFAEGEETFEGQPPGQIGYRPALDFRRRMEVSGWVELVVRPGCLGTNVSWTASI